MRHGVGKRAIKKNHAVLIRACAVGGTGGRPARSRRGRPAPGRGVSGGGRGGLRSRGGARAGRRDGRPRAEGPPGVGISGNPRATPGVQP